jgi:hypothetical protein
MRTFALILAIGLLSSAVSQQPNGAQSPNVDCKESKRAIPYEWFVEAVNKGERGDGVHYAWMDKMRQLGVKQAFFIVQFSYRNGAYKYRVKEVHYFRHYYCYKDEVKSGKSRRAIRETGLEQELNDAIITRVKRFEKPYKLGDVEEGEEYYYLLDDENLPIVDFVT